MAAFRMLEVENRERVRGRPHFTEMMDDLISAGGRRRQTSGGPSFRYAHNLHRWTRPSSVLLPCSSNAASFDCHPQLDDFSHQHHTGV